MTFVLLLPTILSFLVLAAHFLRGGSLMLVLACLALCGLLALRRWWVVRVAQVVLILAAVEWVFTAQAIIESRVEEGGNGLRPAIILLAVAAFNLLALALLQTRTLRVRYAGEKAAGTKPRATSRETVLQD